MPRSAQGQACLEKRSRTTVVGDDPENVPLGREGSLDGPVRTGIPQPQRTILFEGSASTLAGWALLRFETTNLNFALALRSRSNLSTNS